MSIPCDREGVFRAAIYDYGVDEAESGALAVVLYANLLEYFDPSAKSWVPWEEYGMIAEGRVWVIKKDGTPNSGAVESLKNFAGWDGQFRSIANATWNPTRCAVSITRDEYKGQTRFRIAFVNDYNKTPGGASNLTPDKAASLDNRYGAALRAIAANATRNAVPQNGSRPPVPPPPKPVAAMSPPPGDDPNEIPF